MQAKYTLFTLDQRASEKSIKKMPPRREIFPVPANTEREETMFQTMWSRRPACRTLSKPATGTVATLATSRPQISVFPVSDERIGIENRRIGGSQRYLTDHTWARCLKVVEIFD
jgi:hypothetical protein